MPRRQRDTGTSHMPSQRQLRIGEPVRFATAVLAATLVTLSPAFAEVCDKVIGEHWRPGDGPAGTYVLPLFWTLIPPGMWIVFLGILGFFATGVLGGGSFRLVAAKLNWLGYLCVALFAIAAVIELYDVTHPDSIIVGAIKEGCMSLHFESVRVWVGIGTPTLVSVLFALTAYGAKRLQRAVEAEPAN
jgi:hypothetical protein